MSALASIANAERALSAQINAAADAIDTIAVGSIPAALERLKASSEAAKDRLATASLLLHATCAEVLADLQRFAELVAEDLQANEQLPAEQPQQQQQHPEMTIISVEPVVSVDVPEVLQPAFETTEQKPDDAIVTVAANAPVASDDGHEPLTPMPVSIVDDAISEDVPVVAEPKKKNKSGGRRKQT